MKHLEQELLCNKLLALLRDENNMTPSQLKWAKENYEKLTDTFNGDYKKAFSVIATEYGSFAEGTIEQCIASIESQLTDFAANHAKIEKSPAARLKSLAQRFNSNLDKLSGLDIEIAGRDLTEAQRKRLQVALENSKVRIIEEPNYRRCEAFGSSEKRFNGLSVEVNR
ncbi:MAG: hypothetical protein ACLQVY_00455 [Limisphaerales bacterium]